MSFGSGPNRVGKHLCNKLANTEWTEWEDAGASVDQGRTARVAEPLADILTSSASFMA